MDLSVDKFKKRFPNIANEMEQNKMRVKIDSVRSEDKDDKSVKSLSGYVPDIVDFLRRCNSSEEANEIINFLEKRGEISHEHANKLRNQLLEKGLRSFGSKKEHGYYFKQGKV